MNVYIITEGGRDIGFGHITRCLSIYQAFEKIGITPFMLIQGDDTIHTLLQGIRYQLIDWQKENEKLNSLLSNADMVIIDSYLAEKKLYKEISQKVKISVYIDDNNRIRYPPGIVINGTTYAKKLGFKKTPGTTYLLGKQYALFRKEFWHVPQKHIKKRITSILVFLGANDSKNLTPKILQLLIKEYPEWEKNILITDGFTNVSKLISMKDSNTVIIKNADVKKIKELMISSDIAITSGGQTIYELCRIGIPAVVIAVAENQMQSIGDLKKLGVIFYAGKWNNAALMNNMQKYLETLNIYDTRLKTSAKMRKVFDGKSTLHLVKKLTMYYKRYGHEKKT